MAIRKPHKSVVSCTTAHWLKKILKLAGVEVSIFSSHSVRASTSATAGDSVTMNEIM